MTAPFFDSGTGTVRFWVMGGADPIEACIYRETLQLHFSPDTPDEEPLQTYLRFAPCIDAVVRSRAAQGAAEPVMLRNYDLRTSAGKAQATTGSENSRPTASSACS